MKIKDEEYPINPYFGRVDGFYNITFNSKELCEVLDVLKIKLLELKEKNKDLHFNYTINLNNSHLELCWSRSFNTEEQKKVDEMIRNRDKEIEASNFRDLKRKAKKIGFKLVKK